MRRALMVFLILMFALGAGSVVLMACEDGKQTEAEKKNKPNSVDQLDKCVKQCEQAWESSKKTKDDSIKKGECKKACSN